MLDMTSTTTRASLSQPVQMRQQRQTASEADGRNAPAGGTSLPAAAVTQKSASPELPKLEKLAENISNFVRSMNRDLTFRVDEASGHTVVTVIDGETEEVIRQIPSEEFLRMAEVIATSNAVLLDMEA